MISSVRSVAIYVSDQNRAKKFFTKTLGFATIQDTPLGAGSDVPRWIEVSPPDSNVVLVLLTPDDQTERVGTLSNVLFDCRDIYATYAELKGKGVEFIGEPQKQFRGWTVMFKDPDGNIYRLGQRGEWP